MNEQRALAWAAWYSPAMDECCSAAFVFLSVGLAIGYVLGLTACKRRKRPDPSEGDSLRMDVTEEKKNK